MVYVNYLFLWGVEEFLEVVFFEYEILNVRNSYVLCEVCVDKRWYCVYLCFFSNIVLLFLVC